MQKHEGDVSFLPPIANWGEHMVILIFLVIFFPRNCIQIDDFVSSIIKYLALKDPTQMSQCVILCNIVLNI